MKPSKPAKLPIILGGVAITIFAVITQDLRANQGSVTMAPTVAHSATPTSSRVPYPSADWNCPLAIQLQITPRGLEDPICVYRLGTVGSRLRADFFTEYLEIRKRLTKEGATLREIEEALVEHDLILIEVIQGKRTHPDEI